jgi:DNA-binding Lrp family transcriptional regulator
MISSIDKMDVQINGRMTNVQLAANAGISAPPCLRRVRVLEEAGIIEGYHASVNAYIGVLRLLFLPK